MHCEMSTAWVLFETQDKLRNALDDFTKSADRNAESFVKKAKEEYPEETHRLIDELATELKKQTMSLGRVLNTGDISSTISKCRLHHTRVCKVAFSLAKKIKENYEVDISELEKFVGSL